MGSISSYLKQGFCNELGCLPRFWLPFLNNKNDSYKLLTPLITCQDQNVAFNFLWGQLPIQWLHGMTTWLKSFDEIDSIWFLYIFVGFGLLALLTCNLSQGENKMNVVTGWANALVILKENSRHFVGAQLVTTVIFFLAWYKSRVKWWANCPKSEAISFIEFIKYK